MAASKASTSSDDEKTEKQVKSIIVSVAQDHKLEAVADQLKANGLDVSQSLEAIGVLFGSATEDALVKLKEVEGVISIEEQKDDYRTMK